MSKTKTMENQRPPKLSESGFYRGCLATLHYINAVLIFFCLRSKQKFWGIVYDSVTKKPIDPVMVTLVYADTLDELESQVTDISGKYGFLVRPGKFKILAKRANYRFPSQFVAGDKDGNYDHLYHGEFFELDNDLAVVAPNIPLDPLGQDWNQQAKTAYISFHYDRDYLARRLAAALLWFGFTLCLAYFVFGVAHGRWFTGWTYALAPFVFLLVLAVLVPKVRLWGTLDFSEKDFGKNLFVELSRTSLPGMSFGRGPVAFDGKFFLRNNPGEYVLTVKRVEPDEKITELASCGTVVSNEGVINGKFKLF